MVCIGKILLSAKGITDEITYNHPIDICSVSMSKFDNLVIRSAKGRAALRKGHA